MSAYLVQVYAEKKITPSLGKRFSPPAFTCRHLKNKERKNRSFETALNSGNILLPTTDSLGRLYILKTRTDYQYFEVLKYILLETIDNGI